MTRDEPNQPKLSREERLAAKLRENLRRRKVQKQAHARASAGSEQPPLPNGEAKS